MASSLYLPLIRTFLSFCFINLQIFSHVDRIRLLWIAALCHLGVSDLQPGDSFHHILKYFAAAVVTKLPKKYQETEKNP